jgi:hypothetical protein
VTESERVYQPRYGTPKNVRGDFNNVASVSLFPAHTLLPKSSVVCFIESLYSAVSGTEMAQDRNGKQVMVGSRVRLIGLPGTWVEELPEQERIDVTSMIGEVFTVKEVDEGRAEISKWWDDGDGVSHGHSIWLDPFEMEVVDPARLSD